MNTSELQLFALDRDLAYGQALAGPLGVEVARHEERIFEDGEHKARPLVDVRGRDVFVLHALYGDARDSPNDKLCRLLFFTGALKDAAARRVTAVVPYLCYARKDRTTQARDPVTTKYVARLFEAAGVDAVITVDVHNLAAFQNAFRIATDHLEAAPLFIAYLAPSLAGREVAVVSPDAGGVKRANAFRTALETQVQSPVTAAFVEKYRSGGVLSGEAFVGEVAGRTAILVDDLISTGSTLRRAAKACRDAGAASVIAIATHGLFIDGARPLIDDPAIDRIVVGDTVPPFRPDSAAVARLEVVPTAGLVAAAIRRAHDGG